VLFGGFAIAQAIHAATRTAPEGKRIHSLHAYFLRPMMAGPTVHYRVKAVRDGRTFALRQVEAVQDGKPVLTMACSFTTDTDGYEYELKTIAAVPDPTDLAVDLGPGPWERARLGPSEPGADGTRRSTARAWSRIARPLPEDPHLHAALLGFLTDVTETGGRPLHLDGDTTGMVSLDHAVWFHRLPRADDWLFYDVHSLINTGGRGLLRGSIHTLDRKLCISVAQEMMLRPVT